MVLQAKNVQDTESLCVIAYGSNLPISPLVSDDPIDVALGLLSTESLRILSQSHRYRSPAFPPGSGPDFVNGAIFCATQLTPKALLDVLHNVELKTGRTKKKRWEARVIDLDLLDFGGRVEPDLETYNIWKKLNLAEQMSHAPEQMILPHPRIEDRLFVLVPMRDVVPDWVHPVSCKSLDQLIDKFSRQDLSEIRPIDPASDHV